MTWSATGGNPDGNVFIEDSVTGGTTYFVAPAKFHGDHSDTYGQSLTFDLKQVIGSPNQFDNDDVILATSGLTLAYDTPNNPALNGSWTSFTVPLAESGWHIGSIAGAAVYLVGRTSLPGDYNGNGVVDAADYVIWWRRARHQ